MTDRTPPQEREREARQACFVRFRDHESLRSLRAQKDDDTNDLLDAYAAAVAARVRAEMRETVRQCCQHAPDCGVFDFADSSERRCRCHLNSPVSLEAHLMAALAEETTG